MSYTYKYDISAYNPDPTTGEGTLLEFCNFYQNQCTGGICSNNICTWSGTGSLGATVKLAGGNVCTNVNDSSKSYIPTPTGSYNTAFVTLAFPTNETCTFTTPSYSS
jgi:hypothetical protein